jgi:hypothetical protein
LFYSIGGYYINGIDGCSILLVVILLMAIGSDGCSII